MKSSDPRLCLTKPRWPTARVKYPLARGAIGSIVPASIASLVACVASAHVLRAYTVETGVLAFFMVYALAVLPLARSAARTRVCVRDGYLIVRAGLMGRARRIKCTRIGVARAVPDRFGPWAWENLRVEYRPPSATGYTVAFLDDASAIVAAVTAARAMADDGNRSVSRPPGDDVDD